VRSADFLWHGVCRYGRIFASRTLAMEWKDIRTGWRMLAQEPAQTLAALL
jgi:hypothetical protein